MSALPVPRGTKAGLTVVRPAASYDEILLELVDVEDNVRVDVGELDELAASIHELGVIQPIKVTAQPDGRYRVVWGQRRVLACRKLGRLKIPAVIEPASDVDHHGARRSIEQLSENLQRKDLNPIEEAVALREVLDADPKLTQEALADKLGMSRPWVSNTLRLLNLVEPVQEQIRAGAISAAHGKLIAALPDKYQRELGERVVSSKWTSRDLEREIQWKQDAAAQEERKARKTEKALPKAIAALTAAGIAAGSTVYVQGSYDLDGRAIETAVKRGGWRVVTNEYVRGRGEASKCDCTVVRLEFSRKWLVTPGCINDRHRDRQRNVDNRAEQERRKAIDARVEVLRGHVRKALEAVPVPLLLLAHGDTWGLPKLVENAPTTDPTDLRNLVAAAMVDRIDASRFWNDRRAAMEIALESLIAMFEPAEAPA